MMLSAASRILVVSACCTCFPVLKVVAEPLLGASARPMGEAQHQWVSKAGKLVRELLDLVRNAPEMEEPDLSKDSEVIRRMSL
jgi:hypothetical protein